MADPILIVTIASAALALFALGKALWHVWKYECRLRDGDR